MIKEQQITWIKYLKFKSADFDHSITAQIGWFREDQQLYELCWENFFKIWYYFFLFSYESSQGPGSYIVAGGNPNPLALNNASPANADKSTTKLPSRY